MSCRRYARDAATLRGMLQAWRACHGAAPCNAYSPGGDGEAWLAEPASRTPPGRWSGCPREERSRSLLSRWRRARVLGPSRCRLRVAFHQACLSPARRVAVTMRRARGARGVRGYCDAAQCHLVSGAAAAASAALFRACSWYMRVVGPQTCACACARVRACARARAREVLLRLLVLGIVAPGY